jgi:hypothetical protein
MLLPYGQHDLEPGFGRPVQPVLLPFNRKKLLQNTASYPDANI